MELQVRRDGLLAGGTGKLHGTVMGGLVFRLLVYSDLLFGRNCVAHGAVNVRNAAAGTGVAVDHGFIAVILEQLADSVQYGGGINLIDSSICHGRILVKLRTLFNAALHTARDTEGKTDHGFCLGEKIPGIHIRRRTFKTFHIADAA